MTTARYSLVVSAALLGLTDVTAGFVAVAYVTAAHGGQPSPAPPPSVPAAPAGAENPDDELIEFLGRDDVGDAMWWEFLKRAAPRRDPQPRPPPPPQDAQS